MATGINSDQIDPRGSVGRQLVQILRTRIIENRMMPGERVSEAELSVQFGVSRQPVREAFIKLAEEGLVQVRPQRGTFVCKISLRAVEDARFIREAIESDLVRIVAAASDGALVRELRRQLEAQTRLCSLGLTQPNRTEFLRLDDLFHRTLAEAAGRQHLWQVMDGVKSQMDRVRYLTTQNLDIDRIVTQHAAVVDGIEAKDPPRAEAAMRLHLRTILQDLVVHQARTPEVFEGSDIDLHGMARVTLDQREQLLAPEDATGFSPERRSRG
ncbi:GntR family transcriptional regulator [Pseudotabrizicola formosa]|uniref:GntR family transcriptional regulator n=1 Tax=Pseudotabrizicola formosa TaxID=2030009 RepID=UPI000CD181CE|nr:GntR family transcriptional regulator [Pseudotabrizicola formosa]